MRAALAACLALVALAVWAASAGACSCVGGDPRDRLSGARGAFVGTVVEDEAAGEGRRNYRLTVERTYKGTVAGSIDVLSNAGSSCAVDLEVGQRVGLLLRRDSPPHEIGLCDLIEPAELEAATRPYPAGSGSGTARLLVAGTFHDAGLAALDGRGRLLGWAFGVSGEVVDACPGGRFAVLAGDDVAVVRLRDLAVVERRELPDRTTRAVRCLSPSGDELAALTFDFDDRSEHVRLVLRRGDRTRDLGVRPSDVAALGDRAAYLALRPADSHRLVAIDYATRATEVLLTRRGSLAAVALSPDGRRLAFVAAPPRGRRYRLGVVSTADSSVRTVALGRLRAPLWLSKDRLAVPDEGRPGDVFDARLRRLGAVASWSTDLAVRAARRVWWLETGTGLRGRSLDGPRTRLTLVDYLAGARGLSAVTGSGRVSGASRRPPRSAATAGAASACGRSSSD